MRDTDGCSIVEMVKSVKSEVGSKFNGKCLQITEDMCLPENRVP